MNDPPFWLTDEQSARLWAHLPTDTRGKARVAAMSDHVVEWVDKPIKNVRQGFTNAASTVGLGWAGGRRIPHVLRHPRAAGSKAP